MNESLPIYELKPGELHVSDSPCVIKTLLGSCVSVTVHNTKHGYGGMNHFQLPYELEKRSLGKNDFRFGDVATRRLLDRMLEYDSNRRNLSVKLFGGCRVVGPLNESEVGRKNIRAAREVLEEYGLSVSKEHVSRETGMKIRFNTSDNRVLVRDIQKSSRSQDTGDEYQEIKTRDSKISELLRGKREDEAIDLMEKNPDETG